MGNDASTPVGAAPAANAPKAVISDEDRNNAAKAHTADRRPDGRIECSCGMVVGDMHIHGLHIEAHAANMRPMQASGWPLKHFETVPNGDKIQKGIVAKGDITCGIFMTVALKPDVDDQTVRTAVSTIEEIGAKVVEDFIEDPQLRTEENVRLITVIGIAPSLWKKWDACPPNEMIEFKDKICPQTKQVIFPSTADSEDIFLMVKAHRQDICYEVCKRFERAIGNANLRDSSQFVGFRYAHGVKYREAYAKDLTGFIDGTRNPDHVMRAIVDNCVIFEDDDDGLHVGGSYLYAGRYIHDLKHVGFFS
jgi:deferrochelatase/peroxidase EfeB